MHVEFYYYSILLTRIENLGTFSNLAPSESGTVSPIFKIGSNWLKAVKIDRKSFAISGYMKGSSKVEIRCGQ